VKEDKYIELIKKQYGNVDNANSELFHLWYENTFLHFEWWLGILLTVLPWLIWIKVRPRESTDRLLYVGFIVIIITCWLDFLGISLGLWFYIHKVIPTIPSFIPFDLTILPVTVLLLLQYKQHISPYIKAIFFAFVSSFIGEPIFKWIDFYEEIHWSSFYSLPFYFVIYLIAHYVSSQCRFSPLPSENKQ
jgi:hypothetical protein